MNTFDKELLTDVKTFVLCQNRPQAVALLEWADKWGVRSADGGSLLREDNIQPYDKTCYDLEYGGFIDYDLLEMFILDGTVTLITFDEARKRNKFKNKFSEFRRKNETNKNR